VRGDINAAGARRISSFGIWVLSWMLGPYSCLLERKLQDAPECFILTTHLALFFQLLQISDTVTAWARLPFFSGISFFLTGFY
jgi:hypothetical protein